MNLEDFQFYAALSEFVLESAELQATSTKIFVAWLDGVELRIRTLRALADLPDGEVKRAANAQFDAIASKFASELTEKKPAILDALARLESNQERIGHALARLKAALEPPPPEQESPYDA